MRGSALAVTLPDLDTQNHPDLCNDSAQMSVAEWSCCDDSFQLVLAGLCWCVGHGNEGTLPLPKNTALPEKVALADLARRGLVANGIK